jgi:hypothetical protein
MFMSPVGLRPDEGFAGDAQHKLNTTDPSSHQRECPTSTNLYLSRNNSCLTRGQNGRLNVGRNIIWLFSLL